MYRLADKPAEAGGERLERALMIRRFLSALVASAIATVLLAAAPVQQEEPQANEDEITVPEGTEFKLQLHTTINSKTSKAGDRVLTTLLDPVAVEDQDVLSKGVRVDGHIGEVKAAGRRGKGGYLTVVFDTVELPNGEKVAILGSLTEIFSSEGGDRSVVGPEGDLKRSEERRVGKEGRSRWAPY